MIPVPPRIGSLITGALRSLLSSTIANLLPELFLVISANILPPKLSKEKFTTDPKHFPKGNGELEKMEKKAYEVSEEGDEFIDDYLRPGMQTLDYDEIHPNEEWMDNNIEGSSKTGNNPKWANAVETDENKNLNKSRKKGAYNKAKRVAYNKAPQPVISDKPGQESGNGLKLKNESVDKKTEKLNEEFNRMKSLIGYSQKTQ